MTGFYYSVRDWECLHSRYSIYDDMNRRACSFCGSGKYNQNKMGMGMDNYGYGNGEWGMGR